MLIRLAIAVSVLGVLVAACGGGGSTIEATATDFAFAPSTWTVTAGEEVTLRLTNDGTEEHEWVIMSTPINSGGEFTEEAVVWEMEADPGASAQETFTAPAAGTYQIICALEGHFDSGMQGTLTVEEG